MSRAISPSFARLEPLLSPTAHVPEDAEARPDDAQASLEPAVAEQSTCTRSEQENGTKTATVEPTHGALDRANKTKAHAHECPLCGKHLRNASKLEKASKP